MSDKKESKKLALIAQAKKIYIEQHQPHDDKTDPMTMAEASNRGMLMKGQLNEAELYHGFGLNDATEAHWSKKYDAFVVGKDAKQKFLKFFEMFVPMQSESILDKNREPTYEEAKEEYKDASIEFDDVEKDLAELNSKRQNLLMRKMRAQSVFERILKNS